MLISCVCPFILQAQINLVRNPSFETTNTCAIAYWGIDTLWFDDPLLYRTAQYWISPNNESPDYYNSCQLDGLNLSVPRNWFGYQYPHTDNAYMGILPYSLNLVFNPFGDSREYIQTRLQKKLEPGALYCGQFYLSLTYETTHKYHAVAIGDMAMALTQQQPLNDARPILQVPTSQTAILLDPQITQQGTIDRDTGTWQLVQGVFKAKGGEEWLTIGNFRTRQATDTIIIRPAADPASQDIFIAYYYIDDVSVVKVSEPIFTTHDTTACQFPITLEARTGFDRYIWNTGDTTPAVQISAPGTYWVKVLVAGCGEVTDTIRVKPAAYAVLALPDTTVCSSQFPISITAPLGFSSYSWSHGESGLKALFAAGGPYTLEIQTDCGLLRDSFFIQVLPEVPDFDLGGPLDLCQDERNTPVELRPSVALPNYTWSTSTQTPTIMVHNPGTYSLRSSNACGEKTSSVLVVGCPSRLYVPNVFSPNDDGQNDYFNVFGRSIDEITLAVYSRWGELVYREGGIDLKGWDGSFRDKPMPAGVYPYLITYRTTDLEAWQQVQGTVLLVR